MALAALCGLLWHERDVKAGQVAHLTAQAAEFRAAQVEAGRLAADALRHQEAVYQAKAQETDNAYKLAFIDAGKKADAYIAAHTIRSRVRSSAGQSDASATPAGAESGSAQGGDGPSSQADLVAVTAGDIQVCTTNTQRLEAVRDWALGLNP
jgi:hypothetical protein